MTKRYVSILTRPKLTKTERAGVISTITAISRAGRPVGDPLLDPVVLRVAEYALEQAYDHNDLVGTVEIGVVDVQHGAHRRGTASTETYPSLPDLARDLRSASLLEQAKGSGVAWTPGIPRVADLCDHEIARVTMFGGDADDVGGWGPTRAKLDLIGAGYLVYDSAGSRRSGPRFRLGLPLRRHWIIDGSPDPDAAIREWKRAYHLARLALGAIGRLRAKGYDASCDALGNRLYAGYRRPDAAADRRASVGACEGKAFDLEGLVGAFEELGLGNASGTRVETVKKNVKNVKNPGGLRLPNVSAVSPADRPAPPVGEERERRLTLARLSAEKHPIAVAGQGGHRLAWGLALALVRGYALSDEDAAAIFTDWSERCQPPWSEVEIAHKISSAVTQGELPWGHFLPLGPATEAGRRLAETIARWRQ